MPKSTHHYLVAHKARFEDEPLPEATVVASVTNDPRLIGTLCPKLLLEVLAGKMGLVDFEITTAEARDLPGHQLGLPFPMPRKGRR